jgi:N6-adenosine-specific RNA methylase IME4
VTSWPFANLRLLYYGVVVADPPWDFRLRSHRGINKKGAAGNYRVMAIEDIAELPVSELMRHDSACLLWATAPMLEQQLYVLGRWGFRYKSHLIWVKTTKNGKLRHGTGYRVRSCHELLLIGTLGNPDLWGLPSVVQGLAREHSRKPDEVYDVFREATPHAYRCDLFSRQTHQGFDAWGDEAGMFDGCLRGGG